MYAQQSPKPQRPKLLSFAPFEAPLLTRSGPTGLLASCRALQSILGGPVQPIQPVVSPLTASATIQSVNPPNPFAPRPRLLQPPTRKFTPARGLNKRRRDEAEDDDDNEYDHMDIDTDISSWNAIYQTPKRSRRIPADLPLGLQPSDFETLTTTTNTPREQSSNMDEDIIPMAESYNQEEQVTWWSTSSTTATGEDHQILDTVLHKFNLSKRDWNDCAKQLGRDHDSLGRQFTALMGDDNLNLGLRRGTGRMERPGLDVESW